MSAQEYTADQFFPTEPWLQNYQAEINADEEYAAHSDGWGVDFNGAFIFHITDIPLAEKTVADLPDELTDLIDERFVALSEEEIEGIVEAAPEDIRSDIEARGTGAVTEKAYDELMAVPLDDIADWIRPELEQEVPPLLVDLTEQLDQYVIDEDTVYAYLDLHESECQEVEIIGDTDERDHGFVIHGAYDDWKELINGDAGILDQLMGGVMELDGDLQKILRYTDAAVRLTDIAAESESRYLF